MPLRLAVSALTPHYRGTSVTSALAAFSCDASPMTDAPITDLAPGSAVRAVPAEGGPPVFILTASRSGSTLLRFILDSHPDLACPPETMIGSACVSMIQFFYSLEQSGAAERTDISAPPDLSPECLKELRQVLDNAYTRYLEQRGKKRWCDKSLDTYQYAGLLLKIYPEARFICLVRHPMDVIVSGTSNCPWGVSRYGFDPFVVQYPGNNVAAIGAYWLSCNQAILEFHENNQERSMMVRYEDLVTGPEEVMAAVLDFIGASPAPGITRACFTVAHESRGPGDEKIWFTDRVSADSIGQGVVVPPTALPADKRSAINEILTKLSYRTIDDGWQSAVGTVDPRADAPAAPVNSDQVDAAIEPVIQALRDRLESGAVAMGNKILSQWPSVAGVTVRLIAESTGGAHAEVSCQFPDAPNGHGTHPPVTSQNGDHGTALMTASSATWISLLDHKANVMSEILAGRLRCVNPNDSHRMRSDEVHAIGALLGLAPVPVQPL